MGMAPMLPDYGPTLRRWAVGLIAGGAVVAANWRVAYEVTFDVVMLFLVWATDWTEGPF